MGTLPSVLCKDTQIEPSKIPETIEGPRLVVLVCGGSHGAHTASGLAASRNDTEARVLTLYKDEAKRWTKAMRRHNFTVEVTENNGKSTKIIAKPTIVSNDPEAVVPGAHVIIFSMPAFAHPVYLEAIEPHLKPGTVIVGMPGKPGFEFQCLDILKDKARSCVIMSLETLPWATHILEYGCKVKIFATKASVQTSIISGKSHPEADPLGSMQRVLGNKPFLKQTNSYLEIYLSSKSVVHPPIMYGTWKDWDGQPVDVVPLFYQGVNEVAIKYLFGVAGELVATALAFKQQHPGLIMSRVIPLLDWYRHTYADDIKDNRDLWSCLLTNTAYDGLYHPMIEKGRQFMPDFEHRYLVEDVPNGLVVTKGLALIAGVKTPHTDEVLLWCQKTMGKEYLVDGKLTGKDIQETRCPQRYGYNTIDDLVSFL
ncbi:opine dehydrogenase-like [Gigantopelta aegis]|uniref:opine dehydrogenase-like n=1 Tax=Gigantopelta aegis TaxID=1735272 RepID=UPI001B88862E|nr:opine dehydrogenase-like [Gigantopelta aegis]